MAYHKGASPNYSGKDNVRGEGGGQLVTFSDDKKWRPDFHNLGYQYRSIVKRGNDPIHGRPSRRESRFFIMTSLSDINPIWNLLPRRF